MLSQLYLHWRHGLHSTAARGECWLARAPSSSTEIGRSGDAPSLICTPGGASPPLLSASLSNQRRVNAEKRKQNQVKKGLFDASDGRTAALTRACCCHDSGSITAPVTARPSGPQHPWQTSPLVNRQACHKWQLTPHGVHPVPVYCWPSVVDTRPTINWHRDNVYGDLYIQRRRG